MIRVGLIGKTNAGKTTFFNSATSSNEEISTYPFTTKHPKIGNASVISLCVHREFNLKDSPKNSTCVDGWRFIPIELVDLPGLIKGAWEGKGLGNQFLSVAAQSDVLLHIVDASGSIDSSGRLAEPGTGDPIADVSDIEEEMILWYLKLFEGNRDKIIRSINSGSDAVQSITEIFQGIGVKEWHVKRALEENELNDKKIGDFDPLQSRRFASTLRELSKPTLIVANKVDLSAAADNFKRLREHNKHMLVVPCSADAELTLRRAQVKGLIRYFPGDERFEINEKTSLNEKQKWALNFIRKDILGEYLQTGVQFALNVAVFKLLNMNVVYPVADPGKLSDKRGNVLPDAYLMRSGSSVEDLANEIHSDLAKGILYAVDVRNGLRLPINYLVKDRDVLSIISAMKKK
ncbi:MAG: YchF-related putative GTPase [Nitrososphaeraceae archaeon]|jgi:ribosome-binding ATPase|nr:YchF-related putative GTPase [Nitrososphaeraceae archaeon]HVD36717.1 YchF-related putative GTPase [Nitrososphaeraceae archaeon]